jgi:hypothetical protein
LRGAAMSSRAAHGNGIPARDGDLLNLLNLRDL